MRDLFRPTKVMSHDVAQLLVLAVIADLSRLVMRRGRRAHGDGIIADGGHGFRDPAAGAPDGPFLGLLHQEGPMVRPCAGR
jgi:hypothetical protein